MVAIKYIEMPRTCSDCSLCQFDYWEGNICSKTQEKVNSFYKTERGSCCPLIEIEERKVGKWIKSGGSFRCSECIAMPEFRDIRELKYCPNCGAEMKGYENG